MKANRILIVEDEILIADTIDRYLAQRGYQIIGSAISFEEAVDLYLREKPDLVLLDIRLSGPGTGIDVARFIRKQARPAPFIYLTSQLDRHSIDLAKETFPAGYLSKQIQKESLYTTIEMTLHAQIAQKPSAPSITLQDGDAHYKVLPNDIIFLQADHVRLVFLDQGRQLMWARTQAVDIEGDDLHGRQILGSL